MGSCLAAARMATGIVRGKQPMDGVAPDWPAEIHKRLKAMSVTRVAWVPDAGHARLIDHCRADPAMTAITLTTEEEGVALLAGSWLGGDRGVLLMQSSGVGNCVNMFALAATCRLPLLMLVTMRGEWGETNPWQLPMGSIVPETIRLAGGVVVRADHPGEVGEAVTAGARTAFNSAATVAVLISQRVLGSKTFTEAD